MTTGRINQVTIILYGAKGLTRDEPLPGLGKRPEPRRNDLGWELGAKRFATR